MNLSKKIYQSKTFEKLKSFAYLLTLVFQVMLIETQVFFFLCLNQHKVYCTPPVCDGILLCLNGSHYSQVLCRGNCFETSCCILLKLCRVVLCTDFLVILRSTFILRNFPGFLEQRYFVLLCN